MSDNRSSVLSLPFYQIDRRMSQESILSTVDTLLGELEELKRKLAAKETQKIMDVQSNNQVAELEKEVMDLRMENGRLSSIITSLKEQLKGEKEESSDESYFTCVSVIMFKNSN